MDTNISKEVTKNTEVIVQSSEKAPVIIMTQLPDDVMATTASMGELVLPENQNPTAVEAIEENRLEPVIPSEYVETERKEEGLKEEPGMTYLDMNEFMDIMYKCKFCKFSAGSPEEMSSHVLNVHIDCGTAFTNVKSRVEPEVDANTELKTEDSKPEGPVMDHMYTTPLSGDTSIPASQTIHSNTKSTTPDSQEEEKEQFQSVSGEIVQSQSIETATSSDGVINPGPSCEGDCQEIFMCGQCPDMSFKSMELCKVHMAEVHNISIIETEMEVEEAENEDGISATNTTEDRVSIGTQAALIKRPGRRRKQPIDITATGVETAVVLGTDLSQDIKLEPVDEIPEEMAIFSEEFLNQRAREGKRQIKVPKNLQDSYYGNKPSRQSSRTFTDTSTRKPRVREKVNSNQGNRGEFKCEHVICKSKFESEISLEHHKKCHRLSDEGLLMKGYLCFKCSFTSMQWGPMRLHLWTKHSLDLDLLKCNKCEFHTDVQHKLDSHQLIHNEEKRFSCDICAKPFKNLSELLDHAPSHTNQKNDDRPKSCMKSWHKNRQCHICNRVMANAKSLMKHIQYVHDKTKAFQCSFCGHTAARKHMLQLHMRMHTGERPYKCDICPFATGDHNTLRRHRLRHTGEKPYKCRHCPYECIQAISLKIHMKNKHADCEGLYYCRQCHYHTVNERYWAQHLEDHRNGLIEEQVGQKYVPERDTGPGPAKKTENFPCNPEGSIKRPQDSCYRWRW